MIFCFEVDTVVSTSSVPSLEHIPLTIRQTMSARLTELEGRAKTGKDFRQSAALTKALGEIWVDLRKIWRNVVQDDDVLRANTPGNWDPNFNPASKPSTDSSLSPWFTIQQFLIYVLKADADIKYVDGRVLAKLASGRFALAPKPTQKGDSICAYYGDSIIGHFVCRQFQGEISIEADIRHKCYPLAKSGRSSSIYEKREKCGDLRSTAGLETFPVVHCKFVGQCTNNPFLLSKDPDHVSIVALY
jgi:hypothetical protein